MVGLLQNLSLGANAVSESPLTAREAVAEMTWGVNLADLYMAEPAEDLRAVKSTTGYVDYTAKETYDMCVGIWFWDGSFQWVCAYPTEKQDTIQINIPIPDYDEAIANENQDWAFFIIRCGDKNGGNAYKITLSECKIIGADGSILKNTYDFGSNWDGVLSAQGTTSTQGDTNDWHWGYGSQENNWTAEIGYYAEWDEKTQSNRHGADSKYNGAHFTANLTVDLAAELPTESKAEYWYCINRTQSDYKELVDTYMAQGVNVFRLPVTWTWFTHNDGDFAIDEEWLEAVKETVDYILSRGAYCILNMHDDYLQYSYVAESDGNGGYTNFHWEDQWMEDKYKDYVDVRFKAIWTQIAEYFKESSERLILEPFNEPTMQWYSGVPYDSWIARQEKRINELNEIFINTVRSTGGRNKTRLLCLAVAEYNTHTHLDAINLPEDSDYLMVQIHSYEEIERTPSSETWEKATDDLFRDVASFQKKNPGVPVIVGEVGVSHSSQNLANPEAAAQKVKYFFEQAKALGVPCLWWEDYFQVPEGGADSIYWIYDKVNRQWRTEILEAIKTTFPITEPDVPVLLTGIEITTQPDKTEYVEGELFDPTGMIVVATYSDNSARSVTDYSCEPGGPLTKDDTLITVSYVEGGFTKTATVSVCVNAADAPSDPFAGIDSCPGDRTCPMYGYTDLESVAWYHNGIHFCIDNGLMNGMGNNRFEPQNAMTRGMLVTVLWRYAGSPAEGSCNFTDLAQQWYRQAVAWASTNGIVNGMGNNRFEPDSEISREQLAVIFFRYCSSIGIDTSARTDLTIFPDSSQTSEYAREALSWAVAEGLITGMQQGNSVLLAPTGSATRAQVATILMRFIENVENKATAFRDPRAAARGSF